MHTDASTFYMTDERADACSRGNAAHSMSPKDKSPLTMPVPKAFSARSSLTSFSGMDWADSTFEEFKSCLDSYIEWYCLTKLKRALWMEDAQGAQERP
ncbi:MAG: hypothetical protein DUD39_16290 [Coriobacteriaceae bacterium]|nr:MAG: hypothetical protein DUD39_16290 [Coriobacteriaceae bacterium]